ncbi:MAG TPA: DUF1707 and DUF4190 domain-containing protein [Streptosporangiaceae bacterium]|nr:DUF1707 and DUF4190 domain-containing protein [Streptosporangiaceae bacterium]
MSYGADGAGGSGSSGLGDSRGAGRPGSFGSSPGSFGSRAGRPGPPAPPLRATDRDREATVTVLQACYTEGRLDKDEHDARVGQALAAQTYLDLDRLTADLPQRPAYPDAPVAREVPGSRRTNGYAVAALICGIAQPFTGMLSTIPAIALGHVARGQIRRTGDDGKGMATWGLALGWAGLGFVLLFLLGVIAAVTVVTSGGPG